LIYRAFFNLIFSRFDPETAHHLGVVLIKFLGATRLSDLTRLGTNPSALKVMGLTFNGPFGMAAGFDKNAEMVKQLGQLGFSHVEIGTVTRHAQEGNPKPRLFRLKQDLSLINRMGFNNEGADAVAKRLEKLRSSGASLPIIGVNIGKSKITELEDAVSDYEYSAAKLAPFADYIAVNVSSPNTPGLRSLQAIDQLEPILKAVIARALGKPVLVKIAPDLADEDVLAVAQLAIKLGLAGVIATNTTVSRSGLKTGSQKVAAMGAGGLSGPVLKDRAVEILNLLRANLPSEVAIVSVGGVFSSADVLQRLKLGASLVQGYTGFVYEGPLWARKINRGFAVSLAKLGE
jgi:dihydroorotate dehydrogenase